MLWCCRSPLLPARSRTCRQQVARAGSPAGSPCRHVRQDSVSGALMEAGARARPASSGASRGSTSRAAWRSRLRRADEAAGDLAAARDDARDDVRRGSEPRHRRVLLTMFGGYLAAGGAGAINHYIERDIDARMTPHVAAAAAVRADRATRAPSGSACCSARASFALFALAVNMTAALLAMAGLLGYVFVYTLWLKPRTTQNIVIGGAAGAVPPLVGWAAACGPPRPVGVLPVRDRLLLDAAALLGAGAADQGRLRPHRHPDAAGRRRRGRDQATDPALRLAADGDHRPARWPAACSASSTASRAGAGRSLPGLCLRLYRRADRRSALLLFHYSLPIWRCSSAPWRRTR